MTQGRLLVVGIGNVLRQDDGAGWALAEGLVSRLEARREPGHPAPHLLQVQQLTPELALEVVAPGVAAVCFCDVRIGDPVLRLERVTIEQGQPVRMSHEISPGTLLLYASVLDARPIPAWVVTVGGRWFDHGEGLSPEVQEALAGLDAVAAALAEETHGSAAAGSAGA